MDYVKAKIYYPKTSSGKPSMNGRWYVYFHQRDETGEMRMVKKKSGINTGSSVRERMFLAKALAEEINTQLSAGRNFFGLENLNSRKKSLIEVMHQMLEIKKDSIRHRTWRSYKYAIDSMQGFLVHTKIEDAEPGFINNYQAQCYCDYLMKVRKLKGKSFNSLKGDITMFFNMMLAREIITKNPFSAIKKLPEVAGKHIAYTSEEWEKIQSYLGANHPNIQLFTQFVYYTFLRPVELLRLQVKNVDEKNSVIHIYGNQSKNKKSESVVIPDYFMPVIKAINLNQYPGDYFLFSKGFSIGPTAIGRNNITIKFREVLNILGFSSEHTLYSCKHSGVSNAYRLGVDIYAISRQCRHRTITETQNYMRSIGLQPNDEFRMKMV